MLLIGSGRGHLARLRDVSRSGARLDLEDEFPPDHQGREVVLDVLDRPVEGTIVRRTNEAMAVQFDQPLSPEDLERIAPGGSVTAACVAAMGQRTFVARDSGIHLHVAAFQAEELGLPGQLERLLEERLSVPRSDLLSSRDYERLQSLASTSTSQGGAAPWEYRFLAAQGSELRLRRPGAAEAIPQLVDDGLLLLTSPSVVEASATLFEVLGAGSRSLRAFDFTEKQVRLGVTASLAARRRDPQAVAFLREIESWDVPIGLSPPMKLVAVRDIIRSATIGVLLLTGELAMTQLFAGQHLLAVQTTVTGSVITVIFAETAGLLDRILGDEGRPRRRR